MLGTRAGDVEDRLCRLMSPRGREWTLGPEHLNVSIDRKKESERGCAFHKLKNWSNKWDRGSIRYL